MKIYINDEQITVPSEMLPEPGGTDATAANTTLSALLAGLEQSDQGIAIAVNQTIIARQEWDSFALSENDRITLFQAIAGG